MKSNFSVQAESENAARHSKSQPICLRAFSHSTPQLKSVKLRARTLYFHDFSLCFTRLNPLPLKFKDWTWKTWQVKLPYQSRLILFLCLMYVRSHFRYKFKFLFCKAAWLNNSYGWCGLCYCILLELLLLVLLYNTGNSKSSMLAYFEFS